MDVLGWLGWAVAKLFGLVWSIGWFLLGGWVVTLAQLAVIAFLVYGYKYGWRRAPLEIARHLKTFSSFVWMWMRARDVTVAATAAGAKSHVREVVRVVRRGQPGDINVSTLLSVLALAGLGAAVLT